MLKKILVALDNSLPGKKARDYAIDLAQNHGAALTAVGIIDTPWITAAQPEPLGGSAFKVHRDEAIIKQSHDHVQILFDEFNALCAGKNITTRCVEAEGFPSVVIERLAQSHDLIIIGETTDFHFELDENNDATVKHVARDNPRPLIIVPDHPTFGQKILIAKDGSVAASKALHMFLLLGLGDQNQIEVLSIHKDPELAQAIAQHGVEMCHIHNVRAEPHVIETSADEATIILERAQQIDAKLIVMGGFGGSVIKETLFGSCSKRLLRNSTIPLFIHH